MNANKVELEILPETTGFRDGAQRASLEWRLREVERELVRVEAVRSEHPYARAAFFVVAQRSAGFYLLKLTLPLLLIVCFTWSRSG